MVMLRMVRVQCSVLVARGHLDRVHGALLPQVRRNLLPVSIPSLTNIDIKIISR